MGCDIHLVTQRRGADGIWHGIDVSRPCHCVHSASPGKSSGIHSCYGCDGKLYKTGFDSRSYDAFAILANVRNDVHGYHMIPISDARGFPDDIVEAARVLNDQDTFGRSRDDDYDCVDGVWMGDHSYSWLTLRELVMYPHWDKVVEGTSERAREHASGLHEFVLSLIGYRIRNGLSPDDIRIVFGFDS